jgi:galactofuranose transport system permease protein
MKFLNINRNNVSIYATLVLFSLLWLIGGASFRNFFSLRVAVNLINDNSYMFLLAAGMTFVILSGSIDLSCGAILGFTTMLAGVLLNITNLDPVLTIVICLLVGTIAGCMMGLMIQYLKVPSFLATLIFMYLFRGGTRLLGEIITSVSIEDNLFVFFSEAGIPLHYKGIRVLYTGIFALVIFGVILYIQKKTKFGRRIYAIGGNEEAALTMGLPVARTRVQVHALMGFLAALAGIIFAMYTLGGNIATGTLMELDAIAAVVLGGTMLMGGIGSAWGTIFGVLSLSLIQNIISFSGNLNTAHLKILTGIILVIFIVLHTYISKAPSKT